MKKIIVVPALLGILTCSKAIAVDYNVKASFHNPDSISLSCTSSPVSVELPEGIKMECPDGILCPNPAEDGAWKHIFGFNGSVTFSMATTRGYGLMARCNVDDEDAKKYSVSGIDFVLEVSQMPSQPISYFYFVCKRNGTIYKTGETKVEGDDILNQWMANFDLTSCYTGS